MRFMKLVKAEQSNYIDEDKKIFQETHNLMEECKGILDFYLSQDENFNFDNYTLDETDRVYNKANLEALKEIKNKLEVLFTK